MTTGRNKRCMRGWFVSGFPDKKKKKNENENEIK